MRGDTEINSSEQIIDSRDVIERIAYLEDELQSGYEDFKEEFRDDYDDYVDAYTGDMEDMLDFEDWAEKSPKIKSFDDWKSDQEELSGQYSDEVEELNKLQALEDECNWGDWKYGTPLIRDDYFEDYAQELAEDCGDYDSRNVRWPYTCIDWKMAADELKMDYTSVEFDGETFWLRS